MGKTESKSVSDRLTSKQIINFLDEKISFWREYNVNKDGWVDLPFDGFNAAVGVNINHGGWVDHYFNGEPEGKGNFVQLVAMLKSGNYYKPDLNEEDINEAIQEINKVLGLNSETPKLHEDQIYPKDFIDNEMGNYVMVPKVLLADKNLSGSALRVWMAIFERCGRGKNYSFAGLKKVAEDAGVARSTVQEAIAELKSKGLLVEASRGEGKSLKRYPLVRI